VTEGFLVILFYLVIELVAIPRVTEIPFPSSFRSRHFFCQHSAEKFENAGFFIDKTAKRRITISVLARKADYFLVIVGLALFAVCVFTGNYVFLLAGSFLIFLTGALSAIEHLFSELAFRSIEENHD
jgi:hypothetical protein